MAGSILCVVVAACQTDPGAASFLGTYEDYVQAPPEEAAAAAQRVVREMGMQEVSADAKKVVGRLPDGTTVSIWTMPYVEHLTRLRVRVDPGHSESVSVETIRRIKEGVGPQHR